MPEITIPITTSPYPAMLLASGIATMLEQAGAASVTIHFHSSSLRLVSSDTQRLPPPLLSFVTAGGQDAPAGVPVIERDSLWERRQDPGSQRRLSAVRSLNAFSALTGNNTLALRWHTADVAETVASVLTWTPDRVPQPGSTKRSGTAPALQLVNPSCGKGLNASKIGSTEPGQMHADWIGEYLKFVGLWNIALPRAVADSSDFKVYVPLPLPLPGGVDWATFRAWVQDEDHALWSLSHRRMDIQAVLWAARCPSIGSLAVAGFKQVGKALVLMNEATMRIPDWLREAEHQRSICAVLSALNAERYGEQAEALHLLRDAILDGSLQRWSALQRAYGTWALRQKTPQPLITTGLLTAALT